MPKTKPTIKLRKPPTAPDLDAFVAGGGETEEKPARTRKKAPAKLGPSDVWRPKRGAVMKRLTVYLPPDVARRFHATCVGEGATMSAKIEHWVAEYIARGNR